MKELTIEEKAARYDEILARAKGANIPYYKEDIMSKVKEFVDYLLPELKESEDEEIRKCLLSHFSRYQEDEIFLNGITMKQILAWLQKQSEHANFLSKIQAGDKVTRNEDGVLVNLSQLNRVAKKQGEQKPTELTNSQFVEKCKGLSDLEKYILSLVPTRPIDAIKVDARTIRHLVEQEQKPAWSEEDNQYLCGLIGLIEQSKAELPITLKGKAANNCINWLKSLRPQNTWKPSDEQMDALRYVTNFDYGGHKATLVSLYEQLKKLK